jgi:hypothetical protein
MIPFAARVGLDRLGYKVYSVLVINVRHCERSEVIQSVLGQLWIASLRSQ